MQTSLLVSANKSLTWREPLASGCFPVSLIQSASVCASQITACCSLNMQPPPLSQQQTMWPHRPGVLRAVSFPPRHLIPLHSPLLAPTPFQNLMFWSCQPHVEIIRPRSEPPKFWFWFYEIKPPQDYELRPALIIALQEDWKNVGLQTTVVNCGRKCWE